MFGSAGQLIVNGFFYSIGFALMALVVLFILAILGAIINQGKKAEYRETEVKKDG